MSRAIVTLCFLFAAIGGPPSAESSRPIFGQGPLIGDAGILGSALSDRTCDTSCSPAQSRAHAVAVPGTDLLALSFRINEIEVWGHYRTAGAAPGTPPAQDSFTVRVLLPGFMQPGEVVCSLSGLVGTREVVGTGFGYDIYHHTLRLPEPCVVYIPGNQVFWIEVFNDTGSADDWYWLGGAENLQWPPDCCTDYISYGTAVDLNSAPGETWGPAFSPLAFVATIVNVGENQELRVSKAPNDELLLQWDGDCGGGGDYSVYRGNLAVGYASLAPEPGRCDVSGTSTTVPAGEGAADLFLVTPWVAACAGCDCDPADYHCRLQGSYGADSDGVARPKPGTYCYGQTTQSMNDCAP